MCGQDSPSLIVPGLVKFPSLSLIYTPVWEAKRPGHGSDPPSREGGVVLVAALLLYRHPWEEYKEPVILEVFNALSFRGAQSRDVGWRLL